MKKIVNRTIAMLALVCIVVSASAQTANPTPKEAKQWAEKGEWRNGFKPKLFPGTDYVEFYKQYHTNKAWWDKAFTYLANTGMLDTVSAGKHIIAGDDVYASVTEAPTKELDKAGWEEHHTYIDIHLVIKGKEQISAADIATATISKPYDAAKDAAAYDMNTKGQDYIADPNTVFILFPQNAHRPGVRAAGFDKDKKVVIKLRMAL